MSHFQPFDLDRIGGRAALRTLIDEILDAGEEALHFFHRRRQLTIRRKPDNSPVTEADHAIETRLRLFVQKRFPMADFWGEETSVSPQPTHHPLRFIVDPIDGTRIFIRGLPFWSILVGLEADGIPAVGIAYLPATRDLYVGVRGQGAEENGRPLRVSTIAHLKDAFVSHSALHQFKEAHVEFMLPALARQTHTQRGYSDFEGYRHLLTGKIDAVIDPAVHPWDLCATAVMVREAGGQLTSLQGNQTIYGNGAVATNGHLHSELLRLIATAPKKRDSPRAIGANKGG